MIVLFNRTLLNCVRTPVSATNVQRLLCLFPPHLIRLSCRRAVVSRSASYKDTLLNDIRKAREKYQGEELAKELSRIKLRIDNTEVLTQDIVMNLLFSYRDIQVRRGATRAVKKTNKYLLR